MKNHNYIRASIMLAKSQDWAVREFGFNEDGIGDCIGRSSTAALIYSKPEMLQQCVDLLKEGKRWPDDLQNLPDREGKIARNKIDFIWSKWMWKFGRTLYRKYRSQRSITRDPFIGTIVALWLMVELPLPAKEWREQIKELKIPFLLNRPDLYHWKKYLETGNQKHKRKYEWWIRFSLNKRTPGYVLYHMAWMAYCADSDKIKEKLWMILPVWNYALLLLVCTEKYKPAALYHIALAYAKAYKARNTDHWANTDYHVIPGPGDNNHYYLDEEDEYKLDKDELNWVIDNV